jgi:hypothetical protein
MKFEILGRSLGLLSLSFFVAACGASSGSNSSGGNEAAYQADLATITTRQSNHGYPRLANDTQVSYGGNAANLYLGSSLFSRLHWYDYLIIDGNNSPTTSYSTLTSFQGYKGSIRALNPNSVQVAYFSVADYLNYAPGICYQALLTYYAFGNGFSVFSPACTDSGTDDFNSAWLLHDTSGNPLELYPFSGGLYYSHIVDPGNTGWQARWMNAVETMILANQNIDGLYHDWGGFTTIPSQGYFTTVSLLNNGVDNLGGVGNLTNMTNAVNVHWQNGMVSLYTQERVAYPTNFILAANSGWGSSKILSSYTNLIQGTQVEDFLNSVAYGPGWQGAMYTYATWAMNGQSPNFPFIQADINFENQSTNLAAEQDSNHLLYDLMVSSGNNWLTETQLAQLRFGLTSALMFNGYFAASNTNATGGGYSAAYWMDEYAVNSSDTAVVPTDATAAAARAAKGWLGQPLALAYNSTNYPANISTTLWSVLQTGVSNNSNTNVWRRDFTNGIVLVNPTNAAVNNIGLGGTFKKINGVVDPVFNNGATGQTTISLSAQSGIVLHR